VTQPEDVILDVGIFNLGFVAVGPSGVPALAWWADRLARECVIDPTRGRFVDQRWVDLFMGYFNPAVLRDAGMNVAWWNLATRDVTESGRDYLVDGVPLRFFHFSGYDPRTPWLVSRHQGPLPRVTMTERPALQRITGEYAAALAEEGFDEWSCVPSSIPLCATSMAMHCEAPRRRIAMPPQTRSSTATGRSSDGSRHPIPGHPDRDPLRAMFMPSGRSPLSCGPRTQTPTEPIPGDCWSGL
jgi:hypothetical protein